MHHRPGVSSQRSVDDVANCRILVASQDIFGGRISPNINVATSNLVSLRRPSVPIVLPNFIDIHYIIILSGSSLRGEKVQKLHDIFVRKKTHVQICAFSYRPQGTHQKSFTWVQNCIPSDIQKHKKLQ